MKYAHLTSENIKPVSPENWIKLRDLAADIVAKAALKQKQKSEVASENN